MDGTEWVGLFFRWGHILAAIAMLGGTLFMRWTLIPAMATLPDDQRQTLQQAIRQRWSRVVGAASGILLVSGLYNAVVLIKSYHFVGPFGNMYHALVAIKLLLALAVFLLAALLSGRTKAAESMRAQQAKWLTVAALLGITLVCLGGFMRAIDREPKVDGTVSVDQFESLPTHDDNVS